MTMQANYMELTLDQALQKAIDAHKAGKIREADRIYTAILAADPKHADANHNLGVLAVSLGKILEALPFFATAAEENPNISQFWLSYVDALLKLDRLDEANDIVKKANHKGVERNTINLLQQMLINFEETQGNGRPKELENQKAINILETLKLDQALILAKKKAKAGLKSEAQSIYQDILHKFPKNRRALEGIRNLKTEPIERDPQFQEPPQDKLQSLISLFNSGQYEQAIQQTEFLINKFPGSAPLFNIEATLMKAVGQFERSLKSYKKAISIRPDYAEAYNNMGVTLAALGSFAAAIEAYEQAIKLKPNYPEAINNMGNALKAKGQLELALEQYRQAILMKPDYADAHYNMGITLHELRIFDEAIAAYATTTAINPRFAEAFNNMGNSLRDIGKTEEALMAYKKAIDILPGYADAHYNMGVALQQLGRLEESLESHNLALSHNPNFAMAFNNIGTVLRERGDFDGAINAYRRAIEIDNSLAEAHGNLSFLTTYSSENQQIGAVAALLEDQNLSKIDRCNLSFAYAKMNEDIGELDLAFKYYVAGGDLRKKLLGYDFAQDIDAYNRVKTSTPSLISSALGEHKSNSVIPVFIVGMPRSGTTLVEQIISSHSEVSGAGELDHVAKFGCDLVLGNTPPSYEKIIAFRRGYLSKLEEKAFGRRYVTDKMPQNFLNIGLICTALPEAKIVHVKRDAAATCWSNFKHFFPVNGLGYSYNLDDTIGYYKLYSNLIDYWRHTFPQRIYTLDYDRLTVDQEPETRRLVDYLGLRWEDSCLFPEKNERQIKTASQLQVRQRVYRGSSQSWKKFRPYIGDIFDLL